MNTKPQVKVRFAPSPTGFLHIGGVRTALFNYLYARLKGGVFVLRIEDTDTERSKVEFTEDILKSLKWLGLEWDEGPIFQSERFNRYEQVCHELVAKGHAYYCYCTPEELEAERKSLEALGKKPKYSGKCRGEAQLQSAVKQSLAPVIRFKVPHEGETSFHDVIRGTIVFKNEEIEDFVILRANRTPTYNVACVVDDYDGKITHVIRGDDHINNTPKQVLIFQALEFQVPQFVHLPMILGPDKKKLSKRHGSVSSTQYRADGFMPDALINYLARLGWSHGDQEIFSRDELIQFFSLEKIGKSNAVFNPEKLLWLNGHYVRSASDERLSKLLTEDFKPVLEKYGPVLDLEKRLQGAHGLALIALCKQKVRTLVELAQLLAPLVWMGTLNIAAEVAGALVQKAGAVLFQVAEACVPKTSQWDLDIFHKANQKIFKLLTDTVGDHALKAPNKTLLDYGVDAKNLETIYRQVAEELGIKLVQLAQPTRYFVQATQVGPPLFEVLVHMDWEVLRLRLMGSLHKDLR